MGEAEIFSFSGFRPERQSLSLRKKVMWKLFLLFTAFAALQGCADFLPDNSRPAGKLGLSFVEDGPYTKSGTPIPQGVVEDVNVYVFGEGGELLCSRFFRGEDAFVGDLQVSQGKEYSVYAVANWGSECIVEDIPFPSVPARSSSGVATFTAGMKL